MTKKRTNKSIFTKNDDIRIYSTYKLCRHRCNVSTWIRDTVIRDRDETLGSRDRDFKKRVLRYPPL